MKNNNIVHSGTPLKDATQALVLIHGRGASAEGILSLASHFNLQDTAILAPQATSGSWYPQSFMAPVSSNQPELDQALQTIHQLVEDIHTAGIDNSHIAFCGFSQGACLTLEYTTRHADRYAGIVAFTGGLIGREINMQNYTGDFNHTPVLLTTSNPDPHVPYQRVQETAEILESMHAQVLLKAFSGKPHNITPQEISLANQTVFDSLIKK
jgi:phospholipase/carboxylesterase